MRYGPGRRQALGVLAATAAGLLVPTGAAATNRFRTLRAGRPQDVGLAPDALDGVDSAIRARLRPGPDGVFAGAVVLVALDGVVVKQAAYGHAQTHRSGVALARPRPMRTDTVFDLASCSKVVATTAAVMTLVDSGRLGLDQPVARWIPELSGGGREQLTVRHLLTHTAGLWEWQPTYLWATNPRDAIRYVTGLPLRYPVGEGRHYSDLGFMLLGELVRRASGRELREYVRDRVHRPLGMHQTGFRPAGPAARFASTSFGNPYESEMIATGKPYPILGGRGVDDFPGWRRYTLTGEVNDGNAAYGFGGEAGHAGLFSTAHDLAVFAQTLANGGGYGHRRLFRAETVAEFTRDQFQPGQGLGFWTHRFAGVPGLSENGFGHGGFTGTEFAVDPALGLTVVLLTNRQHPDRPYHSLAPTWLAVRQAVGKAMGTRPKTR